MPASTGMTELAEAVLSTASDAIIATDRDGMITFWNPGAARIFGFSADEALGRPLDIIIPENLRGRHNDGYARTMKTGETRYGSGDILSVPALTKEGRRISVEFTIVLLHGDDGGVSGIAAIMRDVSERFQELRLLRRKVAELTPAGG